MIDIDFTPYGALDRTEATKYMYRLGLAIEQDYAAEHRGGGFSINKYNKRIQQAYALPGKRSLLDRKSSFRDAATFGRQLYHGEPISKGGSRNSGQDLARAIAYLFVVEGSYEWKHVRALVREIGPPFTDLLKLQPLTPAGKAEQLSRIELQRIRDIGIGGAAEQLRKVADMLDSYGVDRAKLLRTLAEQKEAHHRTEAEQQQILSRVDKVHQRINTLLQMLTDERDPKQQKQVASLLHSFSDELRAILERAGFSE